MLCASHNALRLCRCIIDTQHWNILGEACYTIVGCVACPQGLLTLLTSPLLLRLLEPNVSWKLFATVIAHSLQGVGRLRARYAILNGRLCRQDIRYTSTQPTTCTLAAGSGSNKLKLTNG
jgi:hypothetical protein